MIMIDWLMKQSLRLVAVYLLVYVNLAHIMIFKIEILELLCTFVYTPCSEKKWYILFLNVTPQLQAQFSYNFQWQLLSN